MANLTRYLQKIFANNSNEVGVFGTGVDKETSKNVETLQSADYENGWSAAIVTNKNYPVWQEMDGVMYGMSYQLAYLLQKGMPEWIATETYYTNDFCRLGNVIYYSLQDGNIGKNPSGEPTYWAEFGGANTDLSNLTATGENHFTNKNLSNLTSTGKTKVVTLANQLDWANAVSITTSSSNSERSYTCTADGIVMVQSAAYGGSTGTRSAVAYLNYQSSPSYDIGNAVTVNTNAATIIQNIYLPFMSGSTAYYWAYVTGGSTQKVNVKFIPFKKS